MAMPHAARYPRAPRARASARDLSCFNYIYILYMLTVHTHNIMISPTLYDITLAVARPGFFLQSSVCACTHDTAHAGMRLHTRRTQDRERAEKMRREREERERESPCTSSETRTLHRPNARMHMSSPRTAHASSPLT